MVVMVGKVKIVALVRMVMKVGIVGIGAFIGIILWAIQHPVF